MKPATEDPKPAAPKPAKRSPKIAPLVCSGCGAPVRLGDKDVSKCLACGTEVPIPAEHRALRAAAARDAATRAKAEELAASIVAPPGFFMRAWSTIGGIAMVVAIVLVAAWLVASLVMCVGTIFKAGFTAGVAALIAGLFLGLPLLVNEAQHAFAKGGTDSADSLSPALSSAALGATFYVLLAVPLILWAYSTGFEDLRAALRRVLAAKPPKTPGGVSECRECGAALDVAEGALVCRCAYCTTENLVAIDKSLVDQSRDDAKTKADDVAAAAREIANERRAGALRVLRRLGWWFLLVPVFALLGRICASVNDDSATFWARAKPGAAMRPHNGKNPQFEPNTKVTFTVLSTYDHCGDQRCEAWYFVPLARGERFDAEVDDGSLEISDPQGRDVGSWYNPSYTWKDVDFSKGAPYTGWYRVVLSRPERTQGPPPTFHWRASR